MTDLGYDVYTMNKSELFGDVGEIITANRLRYECNMHVIRNLYLPYNSHTVEIDMVAIGVDGVYVIENKNYKGIISGKISDEYWSVSYGVIHHKLYNPLLQNRLHISVLRNIVSDVKLYNTVIFNDCVYCLNIDKGVYTLSEFIIKYNLKKYKESVDSERLINILSKYSDMSSDMRLKHVKGLTSVVGGIK